MGCFDVNCGLKQGCSLSSILFNLYINGLIVRINSLDIGIEIDGEKMVYSPMQTTLSYFQKTKMNYNS